MERILITGASGFIGTNLLEDLISKNYEVLNIDWNVPKISERKNVWKKIDIVDYVQFEKKLRNPAEAKPSQVSVS